MALQPERFCDDRTLSELARAMGGPSREVMSIGQLLRSALGHVRAVDLGSGAGRNSLCLSGLGARVTAVDDSRAHIDAILRMNRTMGSDIEIACARVEQFPLVENYDLVLCHGILHFLSTSVALDLVARLKANTNPGGVHVITVSSYSSAYDVPRFFAERGHQNPLQLTDLQKAYADWPCVALERYVKRDHHPGEGYHVHPIDKMVFQRAPRVEQHLLVGEPHRLFTRPRGDVRAFLLADDLTHTPRADVVGRFGEPDLTVAQHASGPQLSFRGMSVRGHSLAVLLWSRNAAYFENDLLVGSSNYLSEWLYTFRMAHEDMAR